MFATPQTRARQISGVDTQRVEDTLALIAPKWTAWIVQTLAQQDRPMRVRDVAARLPFINEQLVSRRLARMHADGLVTRSRDLPGAPYQLTAFGTAVRPVHQALSNWSHDHHLPPNNIAAAERVEDALRRLHLRHSTAVIRSLADGPMRFGRVTEAVGLDDSSARERLVRLQTDGLVTRTGPRHGDPYALTDAGAALGPVYAAVERWNNPTVPTRTATNPVATATRTHLTAAPGPDGIRTEVALRRSPAAPTGLFSHAADPQPRVPATVTTQSSPARGR